MRRNPLDFNKNLFEKTKKYYNTKNILITILIAISVCFFYGKGVSFAPNLRVEAKEYSTSEMLVKNTDEWYFEKFKNSFDNGEKENVDAEMVLNFIDKKLENDIIDMTEGYPIQEMAPFISEYDKKIAGLIVGIAKKESNWGKRSPSRNGETCYNYWGYKGAGSLGTAMGYGCFASPEEAVAAIGGRIEKLVDQDLDTPSKMVVWKCGSSCAATGGQAAANKWISDISVYYDKIVNS